MFFQNMECLSTKIFGYSCMMTRRDIFIILLKCFGLYLIFITFSNSIVYNTSLLSYSEDTGTWIGVIIAYIFYLGLFFLLFVNTTVLTGWLKLDRGLDGDEIAMDKVKSESLVKLVVLGLSAFLVVQSLPSILSKLVFAFSDELVDQEMGRFEKIEILELFIRLLGGILVFTNFRSVAQWLYDKTKEKEIIDMQD
jgi:hypothetical protein